MRAQITSENYFLSAHDMNHFLDVLGSHAILSAINKDAGLYLRQKASH